MVEDQIISFNSNRFEFSDENIQRIYQISIGYIKHNLTFIHI